MSKYVKYAIGEILLVVLGILIALQINSWSQQHQDRKEEQFVLKKLVKNLSRDTLVLSTQIYGLNQNLSHLKVMRNGTRNGDFNFDKQNTVRALSSIFTFKPQTTTFDNLISTGKIQLIRNDSITDAIIEYYNGIQSGLNQVSDADAIYTREQIGPYILSKPGGFFLQNELHHGVWNDSYLLNIVDLKINFNQGLIAWFERTKVYANQLIESISNELDGHD